MKLFLIKCLVCKTVKHHNLSGLQRASLGPVVPHFTEHHGLEGGCWKIFHYQAFQNNKETWGTGSRKMFQNFFIGKFFLGPLYGAWWAKDMLPPPSILLSSQIVFSFKDCRVSDYSQNPRNRIVKITVSLPETGDFVRNDNICTTTLWIMQRAISFCKQGHHHGSKSASKIANEWSGYSSCQNSLELRNKWTRLFESTK